VIEYLPGVRLGAPRSRLPRETQQIFYTIRYALQRTAKALALEIFIHGDCGADGLLIQRKGQSVVARPELHQALRESPRQFFGGELPGLEARVELWNGGEENIRSNGRHAQALNWKAG